MLTWIKTVLRAAQRDGYDVKLIERPLKSGELDELQAAGARHRERRASGGLADDEVDVDLAELTGDTDKTVICLLDRAEVVAALRATWRDGDGAAAGWRHDREGALEGAGMCEAAEAIAAALGVEDAELRAEGAPGDDA
ncbi:hypothetical protein [Sorangium sp. So ce362]|uniref:hypothetical protein n=1 Tax=Sorangium sp. So ce362 TaxID=3133303 RepID=UPI003F5EA07F